MPGTEPLINAGPGGVMEAGLAPARHPESVPFWYDGENVAFRNLGVEKAIGTQHILTIGKKVIRLEQAFVANQRRAYYQCDDFSIFGWNGTGFPYFIGRTSGPAELVPYGNWLFVCQNALWVWKNEGAMELLGASGVNFGLKYKEHVLFVASSSRLIWPDVRDATSFARERAKTAGQLFLRDLGSNLLTMALCGNGVAVYSRDAMRLVKYAGAGVWFGESGEPVNGIGAISTRSVVEAGFKNYGLNRNGFFITDGMSFQYIDTPAFHGYLESRLDWSRQSEVFGWHNEKFQEIMWVYPGVDGEQHGIAFKYTNGSFTRYRLPIYAAAPRDVFEFPLLGTVGGVAYANGTANAKCFVRTKPLDAGNALRFKYFDNFRLVGNWQEGARMRLGLHDLVNGEPEWVYEGPMQDSTWLEREAVFLTIEFNTDEVPNFEVSQILVTGNLAGDIFQ
jgi:hypothetical protein